MGQDLNCTNPFYDYEQDDDGGNATTEMDGAGGEGTEAAAAAAAAPGDGAAAAAAAASARRKPPDPELTKAGRVYKYDAERYERDKAASKEKQDSEGNRFITDQHL